jgi:hypothetical protein
MRPAGRALVLAMPPFLFRCPFTGFRVQGFAVEQTSSDDPDSYEPVSCLACGQVHLVNLETGKTLGQDSDSEG